MQVRMHHRKAWRSMSTTINANGHDPVSGIVAVAVG